MTGSDRVDTSMHTGYINEAKHKTSARVKINIKTFKKFHIRDVHALFHS
jgi:hypothetical protein